MLPNQYPVNLIVEGRPCLVVGGGAVAAQKAATLVACGADVHVVAEGIGPEVRALLEEVGRCDAADGVH